MCGVEFVAPGRLGAFDASVEIGALGRQDEEVEAAALAFVFEDGFEFAAAVDLDCAHFERGTPGLGQLGRGRVI